MNRYRPIVILFVSLIISACGGEEAQEMKEAQPGRDTAATQASASDSTADYNAWLADRYGPESGIVEYEVRSGGQSTSQTWYFDQHGLREARYWRLDEGADPPTHITVIDNGALIVRGPGDPKPLRSVWRPDPNTALPNFRSLTPEMQRLFAIEELPAKEVLGTTCSGYRLKIGETISNVWVWEGILLYGEIQGAAEKKIEPIIMRARSLKTDLPIPEEKFRVEG